MNVFRKLDFIVYNREFKVNEMTGVRAQRSRFRPA